MMSQAVFSKYDKKFQWEVSQIANKKISLMMLKTKNFTYKIVLWRAEVV